MQIYSRSHGGKRAARLLRARRGDGRTATQCRAAERRCTVHCVPLPGSGPADTKTLAVSGSAQAVASPTIPSWNQMRAFLEDMGRLRQLGFSAA
jgi:hypothetical protein